jgi:hypothetical protein
MTKKKRRGNKGKGAGFERDMCRELSKWWTDGQRDDVFWRAAGSGGMAKSRHRFGRKISSQHGDIEAIDFIGKTLTDLMTLELKRGYSKLNIHDFMDWPLHKTKTRPEYEKWFNQAYESMIIGQRPFFFLITKRDGREKLCWYPQPLGRRLRKLGAVIPGPVMTVETNPTMKTSEGYIEETITVECCLLSDWLEGVLPSHIKALAEFYS